MLDQNDSEDRDMAMALAIFTTDFVQYTKNLYVEMADDVQTDMATVVERVDNLAEFEEQMEKMFGEDTVNRLLEIANEFAQLRLYEGGYSSGAPADIDVITNEKLRNVIEQGEIDSFGHAIGVTISSMLSMYYTQDQLTESRRQLALSSILGSGAGGVEGLNDILSTLFGDN